MSGDRGRLRARLLNRDAVIGALALAVSLVFLGATRGLPQAALVPIGPAFYPRILFLVTAGLSVLLLLNGLRQAPAAPGPAVTYHLVLLTFGVFIAYLVALPWLGYRIATALFVAGLSPVLERPRGRGWLVVAILAVVTSLFTYYVFEVYLSVLLPRGRLTEF